MESSATCEESPTAIAHEETPLLRDAARPLPPPGDAPTPAEISTTKLAVVLASVWVRYGNFFRGECVTDLRPPDWCIACVFGQHGHINTSRADIQ